ncbi:MAG: ABC transporter ATP-binding protein [Verrucomicrobia bacterium]|nr:ABC transporter ATP-binding protein [Verrucomicrobiota bacterium]
MRNLLNIVRFAWPYMRRYRHRLLAGILFAAIFGLINGVSVWATKTMVERLTLSPTVSAAASTAVATVASTADTWLAALKTHTNQLMDSWLPLMGRPMDWRQILGGLLLLPLLVIVRSTAGYLSVYCLMWTSQRMVNDLRVAVLKKLNSLSLDFFNRSTMGDLLTRINGDTATLQNSLTGGLSDLIKDPMSIISLITVLCVIDWQMTLVAVGFLLISLIPLRFLGKKARRASQGGLTAGISQSSQLVEALSGIRVVKAFAMEEEQIDRFCALCKVIVHHGMKGVQARGLVQPIIESVSMLGLGVLIVWIVYTGRNVANMAGLLMGMFMLYQPVKRLAALNILFCEASVGVDRLIYIFSEQPTVKEVPHPKRIARFASELRFEDVSFSYGDRMVLKEVNLTIPSGFKLGIAGESGCGKSTLVNLVFRFYDPTHGRITLDSLDLRDTAVNDLRGLMALVSQEIVLFDKTAAENIACGRRGATRAEVEEAARFANAHEFIMKLPQGYDTRIGERGVTLSGGQRQRLSIARAFVRNAPILVLDEATGALDSQSEAEVQAAIDRLAENRTVISIAHRLSTLMTSDRIIVLEQGRIIEEGAFAELLQKGGAFAAMARRQGIVAEAVQPA